ncbi:MAG: hypothetical protein HC781_12080, partial [Leptolyngbyaceae cyanobacterium CSU_1_4]|nr:hypothetical protein [Leptolyngbyaceae cyanobacterium CSU_1_4]
TATTFVLGDEQVGEQVRVNVSYIDDEGTPESINSVAITAIANVNDVPTGFPTITGTATEDQTLTADASGIADDDGLGTFSYQWQSSSDGTTWTDITGATATTFVLDDEQVGEQVRVKVSYVDDEGTAESINSVATAAIANVNDTPTGLPVISGTATEDQTLTADASAIADDDGLGTFSYQWQSSSDGTTWTDIPGATATTFVLGDEQVGEQVRVNVSYIDDEGTPESINSVAITAIANINDAPTLATAIFDQSATEDTPFTFAVPANSFTDIDPGDTLTYTATLANSSPLPTWLTFNSTTRTFSGTPRNANVGNLDLKVKATDQTGAIVEDSFTVKVVNINQPPLITAPIPPTPQEVTATQPFTLKIPVGAFTDPDVGDTLTFSATLESGAPLPPWLLLDVKTGVFTGVPDFLSVGNLSLKVNATDAQGAKTSQLLKLTIANPTGITGISTALIDFSGGKKGVTRRARPGVLLRGTRQSDILRGTKGNDRIKSGKRSDSHGKDKLYGFDGNDRLKAGGGNDYIDGGRGDDFLEGGRGRDLLLGGEGNDRILGGDGEDILIGGSGTDTLTGGNGRDMFAFSNISEGKDAIADFNPTEDVIDLRSLFAQPQFAGATPFVRYLKYVQMTQVGASTEIKIDADGSGIGTAFTTLATLNNMSVGAIGSRNFVIG